MISFFRFVVWRRTRSVILSVARLRNLQSSVNKEINSTLVTSWNALNLHRNSVEFQCGLIQSLEDFAWRYFTRRLEKRKRPYGTFQYRSYRKLVAKDGSRTQGHVYPLSCQRTGMPSSRCRIPNRLAEPARTFRSIKRVGGVPQKKLALGLVTFIYLFRQVDTLWCNLKIITIGKKGAIVGRCEFFLYKAHRLLANGKLTNNRLANA